MKKLIINADDLGLTPGCNKGIIKAMTGGIVTETTLMVNTEYTDQAVADMKKAGLTKVGLHLNLTWGEPLLGNEVPSLTDETGRFRRKIAKSVDLLDPVDIEKELRAQVAKFIATGLELTHLDSHHHAHTYPKVLPIAIKLAQELNVPLRQGKSEVKDEIYQAGLVTTDHISLDFYEHGVTMDNMKKILTSYQEGTLEIMSHPAEPDKVLYEISSYNSYREQELGIFTSPEIKTFIAEQGIELITFQALAK